jgi:hypothetical protein
MPRYPFLAATIICGFPWAASGQLLISPGPGDVNAPAVAVGDVPGRPRLEEAPGSKSTASDSESPVLDAFAIVPDPRPIGPLTDQRQLQSKFDPHFVAVFHEPCSFLYTGTGHYGEVLERDALLIYEGLTLAIKTDGRYEVSLVTETPRIPVVLRLQFLISERVDGVEITRGTITLPPIVLQADPKLDRHQPSQSHVVRRSGYSHLLRQALIRPDEHRDITIRRTGTARFGAIPEQAVYEPVMPGAN